MLRHDNRILKKKKKIYFVSQNSDYDILIGLDKFAIFQIHTFIYNAI